MCLLKKNTIYFTNVMWNDWFVLLISNSRHTQQLAQVTWHDVSDTQSPVCLIDRLSKCLTADKKKNAVCQSETNDHTYCLCVCVCVYRRWRVAGWSVCGRGTWRSSWSTGTVYSDRPLRRSSTSVSSHNLVTCFIHHTCTYTGCVFLSVRLRVCVFL